MAERQGKTERPAFDTAERLLFGKAERLEFDKPERPPFDMRSLQRLGLWGVGAVSGLALTVLAAYSTPGSQRLHGATAQDNGAPDRTAQIINETQRLSEAIRALSADHDRLINRIASLERGLEDVTGAIKRQPAPGGAEVPQVPIVQAPIVQAPVVQAPVVQAPAPQALSASGSAGLETIPAAVAPESAYAKSPPARTANAAEPEPVVEADPDESLPEIGADLGGATGFDSLRALWTSTRRAHARLFAGLKPRVVVREGKAHGPDLRLIAGPLADKETAMRFCAALSAAHRYCQPAPFEGQQFTLVTSEQERRTPEPERRTQASPKPAAPQQRSPAGRP